MYAMLQFPDKKVYVECFISSSGETFYKMKHIAFIMGYKNLTSLNMRYLDHVIRKRDIPALSCLNNTLVLTAEQVIRLLEYGPQKRDTQRVKEWFYALLRGLVGVVPLNENSYLEAMKHPRPHNKVYFNLGNTFISFQNLKENVVWAYQRIAAIAADYRHKMAQQQQQQQHLPACPPPPPPPLVAEGSILRSVLSPPPPPPPALVAEGSILRSLLSPPPPPPPPPATTQTFKLDDLMFSPPASMAPPDPEQQQQQQQSCPDVEEQCSIDISVDLPPPLLENEKEQEPSSSSEKEGTENKKGQTSNMLELDIRFNIKRQCMNSESTTPIFNNNVNEPNRIMVNIPFVLLE